jgi:hypothetical protein
MAALEGRSQILIDNVTRLVEGDLLNQMAEQPMVLLRPLGTSVGRVVQNTFVIFLTGNNAQVAADLTRRTLRAGLDANMEASELRTHSDPQLFEHVRDRRGECVAAVLTAVLYYVNAGRPNCLPQIASYGRWSDTVRSLLVHLGLADPCDSMTELRNTDPRRVEMAGVFEAWLDAIEQDLVTRQRDKRGLLTSELISFAENYPDLKAELLEVAADRKGTDKIDPKGLGAKFRKWEGQVALDHKLLVTRDSHTQKPRWRLVPLAEIEQAEIAEKSL